MKSFVIETEIENNQRLDARDGESIGTLAQFLERQKLGAEAASSSAEVTKKPRHRKRAKNQQPPRSLGVLSLSFISPVDKVGSFCCPVLPETALA